MPLDLRAQALVINAQAALVGGLAHAHVEFVNTVRLGQVIVGAVLHRFDGGFDRSLSCQHDHFGRIRAFMNAAQQFHAVHARHVDVAKQHVNVALFKLAQRRLAIGRCLHPIAEPLQLLLQNEAKIRFVFGNQKSCITLFIHLLFTPHSYGRLRLPVVL